jgi:hypothetical protein
MAELVAPRIACACGSTEFYVDEVITHCADIEDGQLIVTDRDVANDTSRICCKNCDANAPDDIDISELYSCW